MRLRTLISAVAIVALALGAAAQSSVASPPSFTPAELDHLVAPIALYPDPLLGHVLAAATYAADVPEAARWADDHHYLTREQLTDAMSTDAVPWDPTVQALLPFPSVLEMMAEDMPWTEELGDAFLANSSAVMDAVQRMRQLAVDYGYLKSCADLVVRSGPPVEILPANPAFVPVPYYGSEILLAPRGFAESDAVFCGYGINLGTSFRPWGWGSTRVLWSKHVLIVDDVAWNRTWANRRQYTHPYPNVPARRQPRPPESHPLHPRTPQERGRERPSAATGGHRR